MSTCSPSMQHGPSGEQSKDREKEKNHLNIDLASDERETVTNEKTKFPWEPHEGPHWRDGAVTNGKNVSVGTSSYI